MKTIEFLLAKARGYALSPYIWENDRILHGDLDSLDLHELLQDVEKEFGASISVGEIKHSMTWQDLANIINQRKNR